MSRILARRLPAVTLILLLLAACAAPPVASPSPTPSTTPTPEQAATPSPSPTIGALATPQLEFTGQSLTQVGGQPTTTFQFSVTNWADYLPHADLLFAAAPELEGCPAPGGPAGSRAVLDFHDATTGQLIDTFCSLASPAQLERVWFSLPRSQPAPSGVYVTLRDRSSGQLARSVTAPITVAVGPTPTPTGAPPATPTPSETLEWRQAGKIDSAEAVYNVFGFDGGYIATGYGRAKGDDASTPFTIWFSADGSGWRVVDQANFVTPCPGWVAREDIWIERALPPLGGRTVLLASEFDAQSTICDGQSENQFEAHRDVAWLSDDGIEWRREGLAWPLTIARQIRVAWTLDGAWEAIATENGVDPEVGELRLLRSPDGVVWSEVGRLGVHVTWASLVRGSAYGDLRVVTVSEDRDEHASLQAYVSSDGSAWQEMRAPFTGRQEVPNYDDAAYIGAVIAPAGQLESWVFVVELHNNCRRETPRRATFWTTQDFSGWRSGEFPWPVPNVGALVHTGGQLVARGGDYCDVTGGPQPDPPPGERTFASSDGLTWAPIGPVGVGSAWTPLAAGPAGTLMVESSGQVWRLVEEDG